jgi:penicillin-binding protein 1C
MTARQKWLTLLAGLLVGLLLGLLVLRLWPKPALATYFASSRSVTAASGELLRLTLASDEQYRLWTPLEKIAPVMQEAVLLYEDQWFYCHPGFNPWSLLRAGVATALGQRRIGGSTITMQLARRVYRIDSRSVSGKLQQTVGALWLEMRYSKAEILEAYLNTAPFGANIEGVGAASIIYWHKPVASLNVQEALNLAVIPQNPRKRLASSTGADALAQARQRLAALWVARHPNDAHINNATLLALPFQPRARLPFLAPHAVDYLLRTSQEREIHATLDLPRQLLLERLLAEYLKTRATQGVNNASMLLLDSSTMQVKAMVGSSDYHNEAIAGQVNGVFGKRSPGSTLKPFIYAQALDQGLIHSESVLKDAPSNFGAFAPENFDGRFTGPISAQQALIRSRNIPAVDLAVRLSKPNLYDFLKLAGVQKLAPEAHYGLALALGGAEVTMEELAQMYALLPNRGVWQALQYQLPNQVPTRTSQAASGLANGPGLLSPEAAFIVQEMLKQTPRPDTYAPARPAVAWKTGTSWGFRDAWTAGVFGRYVLVVWVGNFDGAGNPALVGIETAAPLFLRVVDALRAEKLAPAEVPHIQPANLSRIEVCAASGDLPNAECPVTSRAWFIAGKSPVRESTLHRTVLIDTRTGQRACSPGPHTRSEVFEYWPSDLAALYKKAGLPLRAPPAGECRSDGAQDGAPHIVSPLRGVTHMQRVSRAESVYLKAEVGAGEGQLRWFADDALLGSSKPGAVLAWKPPRAGRYMLRVVDGNGLSDSRELVIEAVE